jgi:hypothetical protein
MSTVTIPINSFSYTFRKLTFEEEFALEIKPGDNTARIVLAASLVEVSKHPISSVADAQRIIRVMTDPVIERIWLLYKANLPADRFFTVRGLYQAPEPQVVTRTVEADSNRRDTISDRAVADLEKRFGRGELEEAQEISQRILEDARRRGVLTPVTSETTNG